MHRSPDRLWHDGALLRFKPLLTLTAACALLGLALRIVLWWSFAREQQVGVISLAWILPAGLIADTAQALALLGPLALLLWLAPSRWNGTRALRASLLVYAGLWIFALLFLTAVEYFFFEEFDARLNLVAVDYLFYPTEVIGDIRAEYPVGGIVAVTAAVAALTVLAIRGHLLRSLTQPSRLRERSAVFVALVATVVAAVTALDSDSFAISGNRLANELAANGISSFLRAVRTNEMDYHAYYASRDSRRNLHDLSAALARGGGTFTRLPEGRIDRVFPGNPTGLGKLNVVVVVSESFGAEFSRLYGSERDWTPQFDALARQGLWFKHMYASGTRTVRGLEAIVTSFPPIPSVSILRRPGNERIANWGEVMRRHGYRTSFLYGGYGYFDNMNYFFCNNGFEVRDRHQIPGPARFENIWGVADEDLFDMALRYYDGVTRTGQPFFSIIMTTSNHKPFTFRSGVPGVKPAGGGRESGVRYADFAQGAFLRKAAEHAWFDETLFVIVADHGARVYGRTSIPLRSYEIPMLFYSPRHLRPGVVDALTTQIDIAPTVLGLLGLPYRAPFFGQDVLRAPAQHRVALFSHNHDVAIYQDGVLAVLGLGKSITDMRYERKTDSYFRIAPQPHLNDLAVAYYQTAFELFRAHRYE